LVDAVTVNRLLTVPANGADSGAWDVPINANFTSIDGMLGGVVSIALTNANVTLSKPTGSTTPGAGPSQTQNAVIKFSGTLTGNVVITFPVPGFWFVRNNCAGTGSFYVQLSGGAGNKIGAPPGMHCCVFSDGTDMDYVNLGQPGEYLDLAGSALPTWMNACTVAPYLVCDGTVYNVATYPALGAFLGSSFGGNGSTTFGVPDLRGRARYAKDNQGGSAANRITVAGGNFDGTALAGSGGAQNHTQTSSEMPSHTHVASVTDPGHRHTVNGWSSGGGGGTGIFGLISTVTGTASTGVSVSNANTGSGNPFTVLSPALIAGLSLVKT